VDNPERRCRGVASAELDGSPVDPAAIPLTDDGRPRRVHVVLGAHRDEASRSPDRSSSASSSHSP